MVDRDSQESLRAELRSVEEQLTQLRGAVVQMRRGIGERDSGSVDPEDLAASLTSVQEQEALIGALEQRRESLLGRLGSA